MTEAMKWNDLILLVVILTTYTHLGLIVGKYSKCTIKTNDVLIYT